MKRFNVSVHIYDKLGAPMYSAGGTHTLGVFETLSDVFREIAESSDINIPAEDVGNVAIHISEAE